MYIVYAYTYVGKYVGEMWVSVVGMVKCHCSV